MKSSLRLGILVGILGLTAWLSAHSNAAAFPFSPCDIVNGSFCPAANVGTTRTCWNRFTSMPGSCYCDGSRPNFVWHC